MAYIPYLDEIADEKEWESWQYITVVISSYLTILTCVVEIIIAANNLMNFMCPKHSSRKLFCHPMLGLYIWMILDLIANILWYIFQARMHQFPIPLIQYSPATLKIIIGIEQIWLLIELTETVNQANTILRSRSGSVQSVESDQFYN